MDSLPAVSELIAKGRFSEALSLLERLPQIRTRTIEAETLRAELLERCGRYAESEPLARSILKGRSATDSQRSLCEFTLGMILWDRGETTLAIERFQRAVDHAERGDDLWRTCWSQLRLLISLSGRGPWTNASGLLTQLRLNVIRLGDPLVATAMHLFLGEVETKRGLLGSARRHTALGQSLFGREPNIWLEALAENNCAAASILQRDIARGMGHAKRAVELARESGAALVLRAALANLGQLHRLRGDYDEARQLFYQALDTLHSSGEVLNGILDELAKTCIAENRLEEADELLSRIETSLGEQPDRTLYSNRHALLTRVELWARMGRWAEAATGVDDVMRLVSAVGDRDLEIAMLSWRARVQAALHGADAAIGPLNDMAARILESRSVSHLAGYELAVHDVLNARPELPPNRTHLVRVADSYQVLGYRLAPLVHSADAPRQADARLAPATPAADPPPAQHPLQSLAWVLMHAGRPELVATGLISVLATTDGVIGAAAVARHADATEHILASCGQFTQLSACRTFDVGSWAGRCVQLVVQAAPTVEANATVNGVGAIIATTIDLERARLEREERLTLWPADELPAEGDDSVVAGKMREVMIHARKVAQTNVTVLITGESGTGKEVLARSIHRYSARAKKAFVPFNCTAVPRDLIESHLFGYKRGAFTGADRDNQGLIRAAKDGTLFLDEIGELGLDLQPKLLRFLESGEINPLGENSPFAVNVRIVAATNANLTQLVADGRFREDLYYRLNVIPLTLPPLRERREEIPPLAQHFALKWARELGKSGIRVSDELMQHLVLYSWPGNIRQLSNEIHRMVAMAEPDRPLTLDHLPRSLRVETEMLKRRASGLELAMPLTDRLDRAVSTLEREMIKVALRMHEGKVEPAAKSLGISRKGLYLKRQRLGL